MFFANPYPKMSMKRPLDGSQAVPLTSPQYTL